MLACSALLERATSPSRLTREGTATNLGRVPQRKSYLFVCTNSRPDGSPKGSCAARGAVQIQAALKAGLAERGMAKLQARACGASCLDTCWAGPVVAVEPAGHFYGRVTLADVPEILDALANGTRVERLVLPPEDFDEATARPPLPLPFPPAGSKS